MPKMTGSRFMAETISGYGVKAVFYVPYVLPAALVEMDNLGIKRVMCHNEKAAGYMADGYARASRAPGVALAQSIGAANLAAGLQDAALGVSPVIAITGRRPASYRHRRSYQEVDHAPFFDPVTKLNAYVDGIDDLPMLLRQAFREATSGTPGPVHLELMGLACEVVADAETDADVVIEDAFAACPPFRPEPEAARVKQAAALLAKARKPVIVAGGGANTSRAGAEIVALAEKLSIPVATSLNGKGTIPEDHQLSIGVAGTYSRACANQLVCEADLVLFIGSRTGGHVTHFWKVPKPGIAAIQIDVEASEIGRNYPAEVGLCGDAKVAVQCLLDALEAAAGPTAAPDEAWTARVPEVVGAWRSKYEPMLNSDAEPIRPERVCNELTQVLPDDGLVVSDTGHAGIWTGTMLELRKPGQSYIRCAGSLGWGFPAALGAKCANPDRPVFCFTGDGGFWYHLTELETAVRRGINTVTIVNNNRSLNQCRGGSEALYRGQDLSKGDELWKFDDIDFAGVARSMGAFGIRVERPGDIRAALQQALDSDRPAVVDVASDIDAMGPGAYVPE